MLGIDKVFSEINSFTLNNENDYVIIKDSILEINSKFELKLLAVSNDLLQEITYSNNVVFSNKVNGGSILFKKKLFEFNNFFIKKIINHNEFLASKNGKTILFSFHNNLEMVEFDFKVFTFFQEKDFLFIKKGKKIEKYSLNNIYQKSLWQTDISQIGKHIPFPDEEEKEGEVKNFVGVYNNELIVQLTGGKFIGLDLENGKVNWEQNLVENNLTNQVIDYNFGDPYNPFLDEENGKIYILQGEVFIVFDLLTKKATYQWSSLNLPTEDYVFIRQSNIYNNQIVFSAFRKGNIGNDDTIGIFDIKRNEIIWKHTFDFEKDNFIPNSNTNIQMSENRIGALDWKGNLYIFEREKNK